MIYNVDDFRLALAPNCYFFRTLKLAQLENIL